VEINQIFSEELYNEIGDGGFGGRNGDEQ